ncbi:hypothetical protein [Pedobacter ginsengisoli]|uniref:hypothetical protein n=1 Tax=Pedobacter ginsengisoli TaxID=363852 RepID=UPI00254B64B7|nr:hypothetical protein [Pedobacter ginsengisoli]
MKLLTRSLLILFIFSLSAFISDDGPIERLIAALGQLAATHPQEKVYLHTDRPHYAINDTIWFKAYVTIGGQHHLSAKSGSLYVELVNEKDSVAQLLKLPLVAGMTKGCFALTDEMGEGNYRLRAYTQWMRNAGPEYFYDRVFVVRPEENESVFGSVRLNFDGLSQGESFVGAVIRYTDSTGYPLSGIPLKYNLRKDYKTIYTGKGVTDEEGVFRAEFKGLTPEAAAMSHLVTRLELEDGNVVTKTFPVRMQSKEVEIQFFPEGGQLLCGAAQRIAYKVTGPDGLGIPVSGRLAGKAGQQPGEFKSNQFGMGYIKTEVDNNQVRLVNFTLADGSKITGQLPVPQLYGHSLSIDYHPETFQATVSVRQVLPDPAYAQDLYLLVQSGGIAYYATEVSMSDDVARLDVSLKGMPSGIAQFTLFAKTGEPLAERIIFVQQDDQMKVSLKTDTTVYQDREEVYLELTTRASQNKYPPADFSISVFSEDAVPSDAAHETTIFSQLLLSSDIRGYIEQPNYYFHHPTPDTRRNLDILMMTQGYRRFSWRNLNSGKTGPIYFPPEKLGIRVSGKLTGLWHQKIPFGKVFLVNNKIGIVIADTTDQDGRFSFNDLVIAEGLRFSVVGRTKKDGSRVEILLDKYGNQQLTPNVNIADARTDFSKNILLKPKRLSKEEEMNLRARLSSANLLKEVRISARRRDPGLKTLKGYITETIIFNAQDSGKTIVKAINDRALENLKFITQATRTIVTKDTNEQGREYFKVADQKAFMGQQQMSMLINDRYYGPDAINDILQWDVEDVIKIDIVRATSPVRPTVLIYTRTNYVYNPINPSDPYSPSKWAPDMVNIFPRGYDMVKEFYVPRYDNTGQQNSKADFRKTIYWNPSVKVRNGKALLSFFNGDRKGKYKIVAEGINSEGQLGRQIMYYTVH